jgi:hypothetical protein
MVSHHIGTIENIGLHIEGIYVCIFYVPMFLCGEKVIIQPEPNPKI